ncbi:hypothetical protein B046DRAFT_00828 [Streptomyces sp. LamerLS-316]|nr:hypothetical protein B046DRAFT_00828 [Streptomyces sp. LamerLS-316]
MRGPGPRGISVVGPAVGSRGGRWTGPVRSRGRRKWNMQVGAVVVMPVEVTSAGAMPVGVTSAGAVSLGVMPAVMTSAGAVS